MTAAKKQVFIVDDDQFLLDMYTVKFKEEGFEVETFARPEDALEKLKGGAGPDALLLDMVLPGIDGVSFLKTLKEEGLAAGAHIAVLSNQSEDTDIESARAAGAEEYIVKARATPTEVVSHVKRMLRT